MHPWNFIFCSLQLVVKPVFVLGGLRSPCLFGDLPYGCSCDLGLTSFCSSLWFWGFFGRVDLGVWISGIVRLFHHTPLATFTNRPFGRDSEFIVGEGRIAWDVRYRGVLQLSWKEERFKSLAQSSCCWRNILD